MAPELPSRMLTEEDVQAYRRDGAICVRGLYSPTWVARIADFLDMFLAQPAMGLPGVSETFRVGGFTWLTDDAVRDFVLQSPTAHIARQAMGSKRVDFFHDAVFAKKAQTPDPTPWHHDSTFWPLEGEQICSLWTSVDAVDAETSALEFIAGSHRWKQRWKPVAVGGTVMSSEKLEPLPDIEANRSDYEILSWDLQPGDAILFHARAVHGARGNKSPDRPRRAITTRWMGDDVIYRPTGQPDFIYHHELRPGEQVSCALFPQVLPEWDMEALAQRFRGPVFPDPERTARMLEDVARAERVPV